ncbi:MAG TPA: DUF4402 domain-containing protein, partial [Caulobacteraceae bacterium]|nr:DUF4402 domain-containing protein [Caulobacteraceae bacterium]
GAIGTPTGKAAALSNFTVSPISGNLTGVTGSNPLTFSVKPSNKNTAASFYIGADLPITASNSAGAFGPATSQFYVYAGVSNPTTGATVTASASTYRGVSVSGTTLSFGGVVRPNVGSATVTLDPATNQRTISGSSGISAGVSRATFTISGENSMAITVTQDSAMTMTRTGGGTIAVNLTHTAFPTTIGTGGSTGTEGTSTFHTGGSFMVSSGTPVGAYSGAYSTTVSYN